MELNMIINKFNLKYYNSLKQFNNINNIHLEWLNEHINKINNKEQILNTNYPKQDYIYENIYNKPWIKLNQIHKILKIKEFINNLNIKSEKEKIELNEELELLVKTKILTKKENINYDQEKGQIISIVNLCNNDNKYYYKKS